jgi:hypothetical protein
MGILDEAIRDHLDLKRRTGAGESELKRMESEAFGPSSRPAEPGIEPQSARAETAVADLAPPDVAIPPEDLQRTREAPEPDQSSEVEAPGEREELSRPAELRDAGEPGGVGTTFHDLAAEEGLVEPAARPTEAPERIAGEEPVTPGVEDTQPHDAERELAAEGSAEPDVLDLDELDLELEEEVEEALPEPESAEGPGEPGEPEASAEVVEEVTEEQVVEPGEEPATEGEPEEESAEDVLEETPEFLRDTPESDRLWFEQGQPKDFDFDEEE